MTRIAVMGAGALGGYFGARLAMAGEEVSFIARGEHLAAMQQSGLRIRSVFGDFELPVGVIHATDDPSAIGPVDVVLFTVKPFDTESAVSRLPPLVGRSTAVISLQNGVDNEAKFASSIGWEHAVGGVAYVLARVESPGVVRHSGGPTRILIGEMDGRLSPRIQKFAAACRNAGFTADATSDIQSALWSKYAFICAQAGLTAATRLPIGVLRTTPVTWSLFRSVIEEVVAVAGTQGTALPGGTADDLLAVGQGLEPAGYSSLYDDLVGGTGWSSMRSWANSSAALDRHG